MGLTTLTSTRSYAHGMHGAKHFAPCMFVCRSTKMTNVIHRLQHFDIKVTVGWHAEAWAAGIVGPGLLIGLAHTRSSGEKLHHFRRAGGEGERRWQYYPD